jgi:hypothetical protein
VNAVNVFRRCFLPAAAAAATCATALAYPLNGDFSDGLNHWTVVGNVAEIGQQGVLSDTGARHSQIYQGVRWVPNWLVVEFDFQNLLSELVTHGTFRDAFFASLYLVDNIEQFDLQNNVYDDVVPLFDMDTDGPYNSAGTISASDKGGEWLHFRLATANPYAYAVPVFEMFDLNLVGGDSLVLVDNVGLVPEPASFGLLAAGALALALARRRRASASTPPH